MKKKEYKKPAMQVVLLQHKCQLLAGSDPYGVPYWDGEGDKKNRIVFATHRYDEQSKGSCANY